MPISAEQWLAVTGSLNAGKGSLRPRASFKPSSPLFPPPPSNDWKDYYTAMVLVCTPLLLYRLYLVCVVIMMYLVSRPGANILNSSQYTSAGLTADVSISFMNQHAYDGVPWHLLFTMLNVLLYVAMVMVAVFFGVKEYILRTRKKHDWVLTQQLDHLDLYLLNFGHDCEVLFDPETRNVYATLSMKDMDSEPVLKCVRVTSDSKTVKKEKKSDDVETIGHMIGVVMSFFLQLSPLVVLAMLLLLAGDVERNPGPIHVLTMDDHIEVCRYLKIMDENQIILLGGVLGLDHPKLKRMKHVPSDMVAAWLREEDNVLTKSGQPSWNTLVKALESKIIGQNGIARKISNDLEQLKDESCPNTQPPCLSSGSVSNSSGKRSTAFNLEDKSNKETNVQHLHVPQSGLDLATLTKELSSAKDKWHEIGIQLEIPTAQLSAIEDMYPTVDRRLSEMLVYWLDGNTNAPICWESILEGLRAATVNKKGLAEELKQRYCEQGSTRKRPRPLHMSAHQTESEDAYHVELGGN